MSGRLMFAAFDVKLGNPLRKLVLLKLADNANDQGECWPSYKHIADQCEISKRSVINHVNALCDLGLLQKVVRTGGEKGNHSNIYKITLGGAGDSLGGAGDSLGGAGDSLGGSAGAAPGTSHLLESTNEPISIVNPADMTADSKTPAKRQRTKKPAYIREIWNQYPENRRGGNDQQLWKKWRSMRLKESDAEDILRYLAKANPIWSIDGFQFVPGLTKFMNEYRWQGPLPKAGTGGYRDLGLNDTDWGDNMNIGGW